MCERPNEDTFGRSCFVMGRNRPRRRSRPRTVWALRAMRTDGTHGSYKTYAIPGASLFPSSAGSCIPTPHEPFEDENERSKRALLAPGFRLLAPLRLRPELGQWHYRIRMQRPNPVQDLGSQTRSCPIGGKDYLQFRVQIID